MDDNGVRRLTREVWALRIALGVALLAAAAVQLKGQAQQNPNPPVTTTSLTVVDAGGRPRIHLWVDGNRPRVEVVDASGRTVDLVPVPQVRALTQR